MKEILIKSFLVYLIVIICAICLTVASSMIPARNIKESIYDAYELISKEGTYPSNYENSIGFYDNFTNAIYLNVMILQDSEHPLLSGMANNWSESLKEGDGPIDRLGYGISSVYENDPPDGYNAIPYSNYWLSSIFFVKLLLCFFSLGDIRYILYVVCAVMTIYAAKRINALLGGEAMLAFLFTSICLCSMYNVSCFQAAPDILVLDIFSLLMLGRSSSSEDLTRRYVLFFACGMINNVLSFLYAPIMAVNFLIILMYILDESKERARKEKTALISIIMWAVAYISAALTKQLMALLVVGKQIGLGKFKAWSSSQGSFHKYLYAFLIPLRVYARTKPVLAGSVVFIIIFVLVNVISKRKREFFTKYPVSRILKYLLFSSVIAIIYHEVLKNAVGHSFYAQNYFGLVFILFYLAILWCRYGKVKMKNG